MGVSQFNTSNGVLIDGVNIEGGTIDVDGTADGIILDADGDTTISAATDDTIQVKIGGAVDFTFTSNTLTLGSASAIVGASGNYMLFAPIAAQQALSGAGAITVTEYYTAWTTTGANAGTLIDGKAVGQMKKIQMIVDGGDGTLTPTSLSGGTTITFADVGDYVILCWDGTDWVAIELGNAVDGATAPVLA